MNDILGASILGYGFNILGNDNISSVTKAILATPSGQAGTYIDPYSGETFGVPQNVSVTRGAGDQTQDASVIVAKSQRDFQSSLATKVGISGSYGGFSGAFDLAFSNQSRSQQMYCYSLATGSFQSWIVLLQDASTIQQSEEFTNDPDVQAMASQQGFNSDNKSIFFRVFQKWGTHYIDQVIIGGSFNYFVSVDSSYSSDLTSIEANLNLEYKALFVDAKAQSSADWTTLGKEWVSRRQSSWTATGGNTAMLKAINAQPTYGDSDSGAFSAWVDSIATSPAMIGFHLSDMSTLFSGTVQDAMLAALNAYINEGIFVSADFTVMSNSDIPINPSGTISCSGVTFPNPAPTPAPDPSCWGGAQLVVLDPINLEPILNVGNYTPADGASLWDPFIDAVATLDVKDYFVALSVFGVCVEAAPPGGYPPASFVTWLESCGASLADWRNASTVNCAEDYATSYVFIGQCGLTPGNGIEKFTWDYVPPGKIIGGDYYANAMAPLIPAINGGPYIIRAVQR